MQFRAQSLRLENFLSHRDSTIQLAKRGVVLLKGEVLGSSAADSNGAGKTALCPDGLLFALYGRTLRGASGKSVVSDARAGGNGKNCLVTLSGFDRSGERVTIHRPQQHAKFPKPTITVGATEYVGDDEVKRVLGLLLGGVDFRTFASVLVFGKGDVSFFTEQTDAERKHILGKIMHFEELDSFAKAVKDAIDADDTEIDLLKRELDSVEAAIQALRDTETTLQKQVSWVAERRDARIRGLKRDEDELKVALAKNEDALKYCLSAIPKGKANRAPLVRANYAAHDLAIDLSKQHTYASVDAARTQTEADILHKQADTIQELAGHVCPTCQQDVSVKKSVFLVTAIRTAANGLTAMAGEKAIAAKQLEKDQRKASIYEAEARKKLAEHDVMMEQLQNTANQTRKAIQIAKQRLAELAAEKQETTSTGEHESAMLQQVRNQISDLESQQAQKSVRLTEKNKLRPYDQFWKVGFGPSGIRSMLLDQQLPDLNVAALRYSEGLTDSEIQVRFNTQSELASGERREKFAIEIMISGHPTSYQLCSSGQQRRIDVITTLALSDLASKQVGGAFNVLVLDEVFDGLDATGMERAVQLLMGMGRESVFCVTHQESMANLFPTVETVQYEHGRSRLV